MQVASARSDAVPEVGGGPDPPRRPVRRRFRRHHIASQRRVHGRRLGSGARRPARGMRRGGRGAEARHGVSSVGRRARMRGPPPPWPLPPDPGAPCTLDETSLALGQDGCKSLAPLCRSAPRPRPGGAVEGPCRAAPGGTLGGTLGDSPGEAARLAGACRRALYDAGLTDRRRARDARPHLRDQRWKKAFSSSSGASVPASRW